MQSPSLHARTLGNIGADSVVARDVPAGVIVVGTPPERPKRAQHRQTHILYMMDSAYTLVGLFLTALLAATIFPAQSELVLAGLYLRGSYNPVTLVAVATAGNVLGSLINWCIGRFLMHLGERRWFPVSRNMIERATRWYQRWGVWSLLLAWVPVIGDPLTLGAGILRTDIRVFLILVTIGKASRYIALVAAL